MSKNINIEIKVNSSSEIDEFIDSNKELFKGKAKNLIVKYPYHTEEWIVGSRVTVYNIIKSKYPVSSIFVSEEQYDMFGYVDRNIEVIKVVYVNDEGYNKKDNWAFHRCDSRLWKASKF